MLKMHKNSIKCELHDNSQVHPALRLLNIIASNKKVDVIKESEKEIWAAL